MSITVQKIISKSLEKPDDTLRTISFQFFKKYVAPLEDSIAIETKPRAIKPVPMKLNL